VVEVTDSAAERIRAVVQEKNGAVSGLRVGLQDGGCSGYTYLLEFEPVADGDDLVIEHEGARVFVHPLHLPFLAGSVLRWNEDRFQSGFVLDNPNVKRMCGCGVSFDVG
jgi:iron-sulfur cluster assembly accessory protein